jgi:hypothetical protein
MTTTFATPAHTGHMARTGREPLTARRRVLVVLGAVLAVAIVGWTTLSLVDLMAHQRVDGHRSFAVPSGRVHIQLSGGSVRIVAASGATVDVTRHLSYGLVHPHISERVDAGVLVIDSGCGDSVATYCSTRYDLAVPPAFEVTASSSAGSVAVTGLTGPLDLYSTAGSVSATDVGSTDVRARSTAGSVKVTFTVDPRRVTAATTAGSVLVQVPANGAAYRVDASTTAGHTNVAVPSDPRSDRVITARSTAGNVEVSTR